MVPLLTVLLGLSVLLGQPVDVIGKCSIKTDSPLPVTTTNFGSKNFIEDKTNLYEREEGEEIQLYCGSGFDFIYGRNGEDVHTTHDTKATLRCLSNDFYYYGIQLYGAGKVNCRLNRVNLMFESNKSLPNCGRDMSLVLGFDFGEIGSIKNAALCYDFLGAKLKYFSYTTFPSKNRIVETTQVGQLNELGLDVKVTYSEHLIRSINQLDIDTYISAVFVNNNAFQYASLAQDHELVGYEEMLSTVWLRGLRSGNWAHWLSALREASDAGAHFDVRIGVSGTLEMPVPAVDQANVSRSLVIRLRDGSSLPVPAHIWAHVRALQSTGGDDVEEFVIIGHNSPFFRCYNSSSLCSSMCDQVSWLRGSVFAAFHQFPAYGLVQCCRVEDVAKKLDNFPGAFVEAAATTTTAAPVFISEYKKTLSRILMKPESE